MKKILQLILKGLAKAIIKKYQPLVVGVTGSIGKTGAKEAIATVLSEKFEIRSAQKNYNNEFGLPLVIIGVDSGGSSVIGWLKVFNRAINLLLSKENYPQVLVLEMGIDRPGDMDYLLSITKLDVAVLTYIGSSHLEFFKTKQKLAEEKAKIFSGLNRNGTAVFNIDNELIKQAVKNLKVKTMAYGFSPEADIRAGEVKFSMPGGQVEDLAGVNFKIINGNAIVPVHLNGVVGRPAVYAGLAAMAVGIAFEMDEVAIIEGLRKWKSPNGRTKLIKGINQTTIIDDTYNAAPQSTMAALEILENLALGKKTTSWVVLGDMFELGDDNESGHLMVGEKVAQLSKVYLLYLGENANYYGMGARENGLPEEKIQAFNNHEEIIDYLKKNLEVGDLVLVKGSQGMRMEKIVKGIMLEPERAKELLVRQEESWLN